MSKVKQEWSLDQVPDVIQDTVHLLKNHNYKLHGVYPIPDDPYLWMILVRWENIALADELAALSKLQKILPEHQISLQPIWDIDKGHNTNLAGQLVLIYVPLHFGNRSIKM